MKPISVSMLVGAACICVLVIVTDGLPRNSRFKRETTSVDSSSSSSPAAETEGTTSSTQKPPVFTQNNDFGIGAAAGIGGLTRSVGIGNFQADPKSDAFAPWGAFAGLNLGNGGRIGAGCSGLSCGVQLGQLVLATPQLLGIGRNFFNQQQNNINRPDGSADSGAHGFNPFENVQSFAQEQIARLNERQKELQGQTQENLSHFAQEQIEKLNERQKEVQGQSQENLSNFARFGSQILGNGAGLNLGGNAASTSSISVSSEDGRPVFSSISSVLGPDGKVTTVESGSDMPGSITVKSGNAGDANGVFSATGVHTDSNGKADGFKTSGTVKI